MDLDGKAKKTILRLLRRFSKGISKGKFISAKME
jgi:hypothetical protein